MIQRLFLAIALISLVIGGVVGLAAQSQQRIDEATALGNPVSIAQVDEPDLPRGVLVNNAKDPAEQGNKNGWEGNGKADAVAGLAALAAPITTAAPSATATPTTTLAPAAPPSPSTTAAPVAPPAPSTTAAPAAPPAPTTTAAPTTTTPPAAAPLPPPPPAGSGVPFGFFMYGGSYDSSLFGTYNGGYISIQPGKAAIARLQNARSNGMRLFVMLAGGSQNFQNANNTFNMDKWKSAIDAWAGTDITPFIADGTIAGHFLIDEPNAINTWGGQAVTAAQLDEMARHSKVKWPNLVTVVRAKPTVLPGSGSWQYLDAAWAQYRANDGDVNVYAATQSSSAAAQGLGLVMGLQAVIGGDGSSGVPAGSKWPGKWAMSAAEIRKYGKALIGQSSTCGFVLWRYFNASEWGHWQDPGVQAALVELRNLASQHKATSCAR